ncbi:unnamed protein product [Paramecium sonneborni]|uniref:6-phosphogluconate dehydrogenase NADP-binding domain-containing protein n=1 Tax=Paramecium sonneborni TaxID=65129 RepID=A0A8S1Q2C5_9CILI|nr:unnamed protein product [Paramecium sonneborni]
MNIGVISVSMCKHVMKAADKLRIFNRTKEKSEPLIEVGAEFIESRELSEKRDAVFLMFGYPKDVEQVLLRVQGILQQDKSMIKRINKKIKFICRRGHSQLIIQLHYPNQQKGYLRRQVREEQIQQMVQQVEEMQEELMKDNWQQCVEVNRRLWIEQSRHQKYIVEISN